MTYGQEKVLKNEKEHRHYMSQMYEAQSAGLLRLFIRGNATLSNVVYCTKLYVGRLKSFHLGGSKFGVSRTKAFRSFT